MLSATFQALNDDQSAAGPDPWSQWQGGSYFRGGRDLACASPHPQAPGDSDVSKYGQRGGSQVLVNLRGDPLFFGRSSAGGGRHRGLPHGRRKGL